MARSTHKPLTVKKVIEKIKDDTLLEKLKQGIKTLKINSLLKKATKKK